jgi:hypothetical protein
MNLKDFKIKVFGMIEELNKDSEYLADDPDLRDKVNEVINQVQFELARMKKIPKYVEMEVSEGDIIDFAKLEKACGYEVYQINMVGGVDYAFKANGTIIKVLESGTAEIELYVYPERIAATTKDKAYEFELSNDALELMPYGVAADLLKSDVSAEYGRVYAERYETMLQRLDSRYAMTSVFIEGGVNV